MMKRKNLELGIRDSSLEPKAYEFFNAHSQKITERKNKFKEGWWRTLGPIPKGIFPRTKCQITLIC